MKVLCVIPARYASTRFPGKPLVIIEGKTMIQRVYEQALKASGLDKVVVATDDERIARSVEAFGGSVVMTRSTHQSGTDRCAEVSEYFPDFDTIINIQGDEPFVDPEQIELLISCFDNPKVKLATLIKKIKTQEELFNFNTPKEFGKGDVRPANRLTGSGPSRAAKSTRSRVHLHAASGIFE